MITRSINKECRSIAYGYGCFALIHVPLIAFALYMSMSYGLSTLEFIKAISRTLTLILIPFSINSIMAVSVWKLLSLSKKGQSIVTVASILLTAAAGCILISTIVSLFTKRMPSWSSPLHTVLPAALLTMGYAYYAYSLRRIIRISNNAIETDRD